MTWLAHWIKRSLYWTCDVSVPNWHINHLKSNKTDCRVEPLYFPQFSVASWVQVIVNVIWTQTILEIESQWLWETLLFLKWYKNVVSEKLNSGWIHNFELMDFILQYGKLYEAILAADKMICWIFVKRFLWSEVFTQLLG